MNSRLKTALSEAHRFSFLFFLRGAVCLFALEGSAVRNNSDILAFICFFIPAPITLEKSYGKFSSEPHELHCSLASSRTLHKFFVVKTLQEGSI